jgi:Nodulation protein S (NodS)
MTSTGYSYSEQVDRNRLYAWEADGSQYEQRKLLLALTSLPRIRYRSAFEAGCSVGALTELLAVRCDRLISSDLTPSEHQDIDSRLRLQDEPLLAVRSIADQWPSGQFDLVVLNEVALRFDEKDLEAVAACVLNSTRSGAHVFAVHSRELTNVRLGADHCHKIIGNTPRLTSVLHHVEEQCVLDIWERW